jgi:TolB-like protein/Tfp pilus assembly protein PilF
MAEEERRLAAIMFTDMVGYTALGQRNESLSLAMVEEQRKLIRSVLSKHGGREVKTIGDAFLVEFPNAVDAVRCAYDIQRSIRELNFSLASDKRIYLRIGVHLGEVLESQGDIAGDAVNVASRIEPLAEDGGVCLSRQVYDQVKNKLDFNLPSLGPKSLKNVAEPIEVYKVALPWERADEGASTGFNATTRIAVLPFANMSPDPSDSYLADGITEEIISIASNVSGLSIISRTSVMGYRATTKKLKEIGGELEVGSILEGSFRKAGNKIRITTQLINVSDDTHIWAQSYDRELDDVFAVQTDIAKQVADALRVKILPAERHRIERQPTSSTDAYSLYLKGRYYWNERTEESMKVAIRYFEKAIEKDPGFALAHVGIADCYSVLVGHGYISQAEGFPRAKVSLGKALEITNELGEAHASLGQMLHAEWDWEGSEREFQRALELSPSYATGHHWYSQVLASRGRMREALSEIERAHQLDPNSLIILSAKGIWLYYAGDYKGSMELQERILQTNPDFLPAMANVFWPYVHEGRLEEAAALIPRYMKLIENPTPVLGPLARAYATVGRVAEAKKTLAEAESAGESGYTSPLDIGIAHYYLGEVDLAFEWFGKAVEQRDPGLVWLKAEPEYDPLRTDPRFGVLLKHIGLE